MKLVEIINIKRSVDDLATKHFNNFGVVKSIYALKKKIQEEYDFFVEEERKLIVEYAKQDEQGNPVIEEGLLKFDTPEKREEYVKLINNLYNTEVEGIEKITIREKDFRDELPTPDDLLALDLVVNWE